MAPVDDDRQRWDRRYQHAVDERGPGSTAVEPTAPDVLAWFPDLVDRLPGAGRALDLACGPGSVALWLAARGFSVVGLDVSPIAIGLLRDAAGVSGLDGRIDAVVADLDLGIPDDLVDFDLIVCQRFRDPSLYPVMVERLRTGGMSFVTVLSAVGSDDPGAFHAPRGELLAAFTNDTCDIVHHREGNGLASIVLRRR
jgi:SAM-dependent methyltransferase